MQKPFWIFSTYNILYVTIALATLFDFAHGVLYLRPLVYNGSCLLFSFLLLSCSHNALFIIFTCTILECPLCSLHEMTWIYYYYLSVEVILAKQKKYRLLKRDHLESGLSVCVCVRVFCFISIFVLCRVLVVVRSLRQHSCIISAVT